MNKFNICDKCDDCNECDECDVCEENGYPKVAIKVEEILGKIREGRMIDKADAYICEEHYTADRLKIERLSGDTLSMAQCYINLAVVENSAHVAAHLNEKSAKGDSQSSPFSLTARLRIEAPNMAAQVELARIFHNAPRNAGVQPRRILIRGRAGVGKTTLCKKMVHDYIYCGTWKAIFDRILWVPLRTLKIKPDKGYTLEGLFLRHFFSDTPKRGDFATELEKVLDNTRCTRTLFVLDGLDEISEGFDSKSEIHSFLMFLLKRPNVIVTSRPSARIPADLKFDLELETIGFYPKQVQEYIEKRSPEQAAEIGSFLQKRPLIQGLVRIPIQLDALCFVWAKGLDSDQLGTMTAVYEAISKRLQRKDSSRLNKRQNATTAEQEQIEKDNEPIVAFLECLAFNGIYSNVIEFQENHRSNVMRTYPEVIQWLGSFSFGDVSFLRTSDPSAMEAEKSYHFLHLTYQEFFAAQYFARRWQDGQDVEFFKEFGATKAKPTKVSANAFLQENKYNMRYDIVWRFTVGLLEPNKVQSFFEAIERQPLDLLGHTHQRLVMHCLSEADKWEGKLRSALELKLSQWVRLECDLRGSSLLVAESDFPDEVLCATLDDRSSSQQKQLILRSLQLSRYLSEIAFAKLAAIIKNENDRDTRLAAVEVLAGRLSLPEAVLTTLVAVLRDENENIRSRAALILSRQSIEATHAVLLGMLRNRNENKNTRSGAAYALARPSDFSPSDIMSLIEILEDKNEDEAIRSRVALVLRRQSTLPPAAATAIVAILKDKEQNTNIRDKATDALRTQLREDIVQVLVAIIRDKNETPETRSCAARVLRQQQLLPPHITALTNMFQDKNQDVRRSAVESLTRGFTTRGFTTRGLITREFRLSEDVITALVAMLRDKDKVIRRNVIDVLDEQSHLPETAIAALLRVLKNGGVEAYHASQALKWQSLSEVTIATLVNMLLGTNSYRTAHEIAVVLRLQSKLPKVAVATLTEALATGRRVRCNAAEPAGWQSSLPMATITAIMTILKKLPGVKKDSTKALGAEVRFAVAEALAGQSDLPENVIRFYTEELRRRVGYRGGKDIILGALERQSSLPEPTLTVLVEVLKSESARKWHEAVQILKRSSLPESTITALVAALEHEDKQVRTSAAYCLNNQSCLHLPESAVLSIVAMLKDDDSDARAMAAEVLQSQSNLPKTIIEVIVSLLSGEAQFIVAQVLGEDSELLNRIIEVVVLGLESEGASDSFNPEMMKLLYGCLIYRSFKEQFCLYIDEDDVVISLPNGLQQRTAQPAGLRGAIHAGRRLYGMDSSLLWSNPFENATN